MSAFSRLPALAAFSLILTACSTVPEVSPSAPNSEHDASWLDVRDMPPPTGRAAPSVGVSPSAPRSVQDATTLQLR